MKPEMKQSRTVSAGAANKACAKQIARQSVDGGLANEQDFKPIS